MLPCLYLPGGCLTDRKSHHTDRKSHPPRQRDGERDRQEVSHRQTDRQAEGERDRQEVSSTQTGSLTHPDRQTDRLIHLDRQTDRLIHPDRERQVARLS